MLAGGCFWGVQGVFQHVDGRAERGLGLCRRRRGDGALPGGRQRRDRPCGGGGGHLRSGKDQLRQAPADLLLGGARPDPAQPAGAGHRAPSTARRSSRRTRRRRRSPTAYIAQLDAAEVFDAPIVTTIEPGRAFYPAEDYHQDYLTLNPTQPYIVYNDLPKIENLKRLFPDDLPRRPGAGVGGGILVTGQGLTAIPCTHNPCTTHAQCMHVRFGRGRRLTRRGPVRSPAGSRRLRRRGASRPGRSLRGRRWCGRRGARGGRRGR